MGDIDDLEIMYQLEQWETVHQPNDHGDKVLFEMIGLSDASFKERFGADPVSSLNLLSGQKKSCGLGWKLFHVFT